MNFHGPIILNSLKVTEGNNLTIKQIPQMAGNLDLFSDQIARWKQDQQKVVIVTPSKRHIDRIHELIHKLDFEVDVDFGKLSEGFHFKSANLVFIPDHEIFGRSSKHRRKR